MVSTPKTPHSDPDTNALSQGATATDTFSYTVSDAAGATSTATLKIAITGSDDNRPPVAVSDTFGGTEDTTVTLSDLTLLGNDTDPDVAHHAGELVAIDKREPGLELALVDPVVSPADPCVGDLDDGLAGSGLWFRNIADLTDARSGDGKCAHGDAGRTT